MSVANAIRFAPARFKKSSTVTTRSYGTVRSPRKTNTVSPFASTAALTFDDNSSSSTLTSSKNMFPPEVTVIGNTVGRVSGAALAAVGKFTCNVFTCTMYNVLSMKNTNKNNIMSIIGMIITSG